MPLKPLIFSLFLALILSNLAAMGTKAVEPSSVQRLIKTKECPSCELTRADLKGLELDHANLKMAVMWKAVMNGVSLTRANLVGAVLHGVDLRGSDLSEAKMIGTYLWGADLSGANLQGANLSGAIFNKANLTGADLRGAILKHALFDGAVFCRTRRPSGREDNSGCQ